MGFQKEIHDLIDSFVVQNTILCNQLSFDSFLKLWKFKSFSFIYDYLLKKPSYENQVQLLFKAAFTRLMTIGHGNYQTENICRESTRAPIYNTKQQKNKEHYTENSANKANNFHHFSKVRIWSYRKRHLIDQSDSNDKQQPPSTNSTVKLSLITRIGSIYTLYMLYFTQPFANNRVRIYTPLSCLKQLIDTVKEIAGIFPHHDAIYCIQRLVQDCAFLTGVLNSLCRDSQFLSQSPNSITDLLHILGRETQTIYLLENLRTIGISYMTMRSRFMCLLPKRFNPIADAYLSFSLSRVFLERRAFTDLIKYYNSGKPKLELKFFDTNKTKESGNIL